MLESARISRSSPSDRHRNNMAGKFALIIGNSQYDDASLGRLRAPDVDVQALEAVLKARDIGRFDEVTCLVNEGFASVRRAIARFYDQRRRDDLLLLYFSGHGVKDEQGHLYLALRDTETQLLAGSALESTFITGRMDRSFSKRQVVMLDCCHSGAFAHGVKAAQGVSVGTAEAFEGLGVGRVILTATDSTQYAWEGDQVIGDAQNSLFTHFLIDGLKTGAADRDNDGLVTVDELFDYVRDQVLVTTPRQTPYKWTYRQQGEIVLASNPFVRAWKLPPEIEEARHSKLSSMRLEAVQNLETLLRGRHVGRARAALAALKDLSTDDSRKVAAAAIEALGAYDATKLAATPEPEPEIERVAAPVPIRRDEPDSTTTDPIERLTADIFLSYAHEDRDKASALADVLNARGWRVWWDRRIAPGEAFDVMIERELSTCKCAVVLWSGNSVNATWVRNEARRAARRRVLVPILIEDVEMPLEFENLQAANLTSWHAATNPPELEAVFERIRGLAPIPYDRLARATVRAARRDFAAGRRDAAIAKLEQFQPVHDLVTRELAELRAEVDRLERARTDADRLARERAEIARREAEAARRDAEAARLEAEGAQRQRELAAERARFEELPLHEHELVEPVAPAASPVEDVEEVATVAAAVVATVPVESRPRRTFRFTARPVRIAVAGAVLVLLVAGGWRVGIWLGRSPAPQPLPQGATPAAGVAAAPAPIENPSPQPKIAAVQPAVDAVPNTPVAPNDPAANATGTSVLPAGGVEELRARAQAQQRSGEHAQALNSVAEGLRIDPRDRGLRILLDSMLRAAQASADHAKQAAVGVDAEANAEEAFGRAVQKEREAVRLRREGKLDAAARSFLVAAAQFGTAAKLAEEETEQARLVDERRKKEAPPVPTNQAERKPLDSAAERELATETLRRYEAGYNAMNAESVRSVYPTALVGELTKEFAEYRSYTLRIAPADFRFVSQADGRILGSAPCRVVYDIVPKSGARLQGERSQTFLLEKQGGKTWIIVGIR